MVGYRLTCSSLLILFIMLDVFTNCHGKEYIFHRYSYRKTQKIEKKLRHERVMCEDKLKCRGKSGLDQISCVRQCMSQSCYDEIYGQDELEVGEIDVRYISFKGCVSGKKRIQ